MFADLESLTSSSLAFGETLVNRIGFDSSRVLLLCLLDRFGQLSSTV